jgi:hypothetical protein
MEQELIAHLNDAQKDRLAKLDAVFSLPGWKLVLEWAAANAAQHEARQLNAQTWDQYNVAKGARLAYLTVTELEEITMNEFAALALQNAETVRLEDEFAHE